VSGDGRTTQRAVRGRADAGSAGALRGASGGGHRRQQPLADTGGDGRDDAAGTRRVGRSGAGLLHYKVCSTFDFAPGIGSIGRVMDIARRVLGGGVIPIVVGAPKLGRFSMFGTLFARHNVDGTVHRIDRHPTMSVHPTTPMNEADMRRHIGAQTEQSIGLLAALEAGRSVVAHSSTGPQDAREAAVTAHFAAQGLSAEAGRIQLGLELRVPDHSTLSRRAKMLEAACCMDLESGRSSPNPV